MERAEVAVFMPNNHFYDSDVQSEGFVSVNESMRVLKTVFEWLTVAPRCKYYAQLDESKYMSEEGHHLDNLVQDTEIKVVEYARKFENWMALRISKSAKKSGHEVVRGIESVFKTEKLDSVKDYGKGQIISEAVTAILAVIMVDTPLVDSALRLVARSSTKTMFLPLI